MTIEARIEQLERRVAERLGLELQSRRIQVGDAEVRLLETGSGRGFPVVFLHPAGFSGAVWLPVASRMRDLRCLLVDQPGHGLSDGVEYLGVEPRAHNTRVLDGLLDHLDLDGVALVGNSLGGQCGLWLAIDAPKRVSRLVIVGVPTVAFPGCRADLGLALASVPLLNRVLLALPRPRSLHRLVLRGPLGPAALRALDPELLEIHRLAGRQPAWRGTMATLMQRLLRWRTPRREMELTDAELGAVRQPTLILWGDDDLYGDPSMARQAAACMPHATVEVMSGGHLPYVEHPEAFVASVRTFLGPGGCDVPEALPASPP